MNTGTTNKDYTLIKNIKIIHKILIPYQKLVLLLFIIMLLCAFLESFAYAIIMPLLNQMTGATSNSGNLQEMFDKILVYIPKNYHILFLCSGLMVLFLFKNIFIAYNTFIFGTCVFFKELNGKMISDDPF